MKSSIVAYCNWKNLFSHILTSVLCCFILLFIACDFISHSYYENIISDPLLNGYCEILANLWPWGQDEIVTISQTTSLNAFSFRLRSHISFFPEVRINNIPALVQIMAWYRPGDKPLSEPMMFSLLTHICFTWPQWVIRNDIANVVSDRFWCKNKFYGPQKRLSNILKSFWTSKLNYWMA